MRQKRLNRKWKFRGLKGLDQVMQLRKNTKKFLTSSEKKKKKRKEKKKEAPPCIN